VLDPDLTSRSASSSSNCPLEGRSDASGSMVLNERGESFVLKTRIDFSQRRVKAWEMRLVDTPEGSRPIPLSFLAERRKPSGLT
jgi:hypothetical protein